MCNHDRGQSCPKTATTMVWGHFGSNLRSRFPCDVLMSKRTSRKVAVQFCHICRQWGGTRRSYFGLEGCNPPCYEHHENWHATSNVTYILPSLGSPLKKRVNIFFLLMHLLFASCHSGPVQRMPPFRIGRFHKFYLHVHDKLGHVKGRLKSF